MGGIFLNYRRDDSTGGYSVAIYDRLVQHFGKDFIFRDLDTLEFGIDFVEEIERAVGTCDVLIALIGEKWLTVQDEEGKRRLDNPEDFVRLEIETALNRNVRVIPALVDGTIMPKKQQLPESLRQLTRKNALFLSVGTIREVLDRLIQNLEKMLQKKESEVTEPQMSKSKDSVSLSDQDSVSKPISKKPLKRKNETTPPTSAMSKAKNKARLSAKDRYNIGGLLACAIDPSKDPDSKKLKRALKHLKLSITEQENLLCVARGFIIPKLFADAIENEATRELAVKELIGFARKDGNYERDWQSDLKQFAIWLGIAI